MALLKVICWALIFIIRTTLQLQRKYRCNCPWVASIFTEVFSRHQRPLYQCIVYILPSFQTKILFGNRNLPKHGSKICVIYLKEDI